MKFIQKYKTLGIIIAAFMLFNTFLISDSGYVDENNLIYSNAVNGRVGIGTDKPINLLHIKKTGTTTFLRIDGDGSNNARILFSDDGSNKWNIGYDDNNGSFNFNDSVKNATPVKFYSPSVENTLVLKGGKVGIGTDNPGEKLTVAGTIHAERIIVDSTPADYVFENDYNLRSLEEVKSFIEENGHLPEIPSAQEVESEGIELGDMNSRLLQKIEELTLYMIEQDKRIAELEKKLAENK